MSCDQFLRSHEKFNVPDDIAVIASFPSSLSYLMPMKPFSRKIYHQFF